MATVDTRDAVGLAQQLSPATSGGGNDPLTKLLQHQAKETHMVTEKLKKLTKFKEDYEALKARLETLPDKISHDVMVPLGRLAFVPGKIKHTNEILCLLGDNWFVERSAKQAAQIIERRIKGCDETIRKFQGELKLMDGWRDQTRQLHEEVNLNQAVNITEVEEDEGWREEHRRKVREYKQKMAALKQEQNEPRDMTTEEELWRRLDELELEEELQHELDLLGVEDFEFSSQDEEEEEEAESAAHVEQNKEPPPTSTTTSPSNNSNSSSNKNKKEKKSVRWSQSPDAVKQFRRDELILPRAHPSSTTTSQPQQHVDDKDQDTTLKITFKHTSPSNKKSARFAASVIDPDAADSEDPSSVVVSSPSEIFRKFCSPPPTSDSSSEAGQESGNGSSSRAEPKSILKVKKSTTPVIEIVQPDEGAEPDAVAGTSAADLQPPLVPPFKQQQTIAALGDEVKERGETASSASSATADAVPAVDQESINTHRPVSRFRAARMNKKL